MQFEAERVRRNVQNATTEDLLDRVTVYRKGMEPEALEIIEGELQDRGIYRDGIRDHWARRDREILPPKDGIAIACSFCHRPAVAEGWGWHWLSKVIWGQRRKLLPLFPRFLHYCQEHCPPSLVPTFSEEPPHLQV
ncbi:MAG TPA: hypothetical protein VGY77_10095 [Gemmataceae bacterium]|jgi:hypothetical protein|nr:hypothetical protein [Gemmataceae bacterium]